MSQNRKILKVVSLIQALVGLAALIAGIFAIVNAQDSAGTFEVFGTTIDASLGCMVLGALSVITGACTFGSCALGIQDMVGLTLKERRDFSLSDGSTRCIFVFEKTGKPRVKLPRRVGLAQKDPLRPR